MPRLLVLIAVLALAGCVGGQSGQEAGPVGESPPAVLDVPAPGEASTTPETPPAGEAPTVPGVLPAEDASTVDDASGDPSPVVDISPFGAVLAFETEEDVLAQVEYGIPERLGLFSAADPAPTRSHRFLLDGLSPDRVWEFRVQVDGAAGAAGTFSTQPLPDESLRVGTTGGHIEVDGHPFFPIMQLAQCPADYPESRALGVDVFLGREQDCEIDDEQLVDAAHAVGALAAVNFEDRIPGRVGLFGYHLRDEPDSLGYPPEEVARKSDEAHGGDPDHPTLVTLSPLLYPEYPSRRAGADREAVYHAYANAADFVGVDLYPHYTLCDDSYVPAVGAVQKLLSTYTENPTFQWIEATASNNGACSGTRSEPVSAEEMRAEVWLAVTNGATGIGYFTHTWTRGHVRLDVSPDLREAMRETNDELKGLSAALLAEPADVEASAPGIHAVARARNGARYVFAVNETREEKPVRFALPVGGHGVLDWRTGERLEAAGDGFDDTLAPLASAVYVLPPAPADG